MTLLQLPLSPFDLAPALGAEAAKSSTDFDNIILVVVIAIACLSLSESVKLLIRRNIGSRVVNIRNVIVSSTVYLGFALLILFAASAFYQTYLPSIFYIGYLLNTYVLVAIALIFIFLSFYSLSRGMNEYYRSNSIKSINWRLLEYRGDSMLVDDAVKKSMSKELIWREYEPKKCLQISAITLLIHPFLGLPLLIASLSFYANEYYQVHYKHERMKNAYLDMKIEMEKASLYYNQSDISKTANKVRSIE